MATTDVVTSRIATTRPSPSPSTSPPSVVTATTPIRGDASLEEVRLAVEIGSCDNIESIQNIDNLHLSDTSSKPNGNDVKVISASSGNVIKYKNDKIPSTSTTKTTTKMITYVSKDVKTTSSAVTPQKSSKKYQVGGAKDESPSNDSKNSKSTKKTFLDDVEHDEDVTSASDGEATWRLLGDVETLRRSKCRRLYAQRGRASDLALFYRQGKFFSMSAWCSHMGGPLYEGDIEDYKGKLHVMCPWHAYMFDVDTGMSDIGLKQEVFPVKIEDSRVFILYDTDLSLNPFLNL